MFMPSAGLGHRPYPAGFPGGDGGVPNTDRFAIRWKGFQTNLSIAVADLIKDLSFSDVIIAAEDGTKMDGHRVVLASGSHYFRELLMDAARISDCCQKPIIILPGVSGRVLKAVMDYLYLGVVYVDHDLLEDFLKTARNLSLKGMIEPKTEVPAPGLSLLSQTAAIFPPRGPTQLAVPSPPPPHLPIMQPPSYRDNGLSILAQAAQVKEAKPFRIYPENNTPEQKRLGGLENDENSPLNFAGAINLSTKESHSNPDPPFRPYDLLNIPDPTSKYQLSPSPTAIDMSTTGINNQAHSPFNESSSSSGGRPTSNPDFDKASPLPIYPLPNILGSVSDHNLTTLTNTETLGQPKKSKRKRKSKSKAEDDDMDENESEQMATPDKNWKSRQPRGCEICDRTFSNKFNLKQHILNMHTPGRTVVCDLCDKKVKNKWYLRRHKVTHHNAPLKK